MGGMVYKYLLGRIEGARIPVANIVFDLCEESGLSASQIDVAAITDTTLGFVRTDMVQARAPIETLMAAYFFDKVESDGKIWFVPRNPTPAKTVTTIPETDLGAFEFGGTPVPKLGRNRLLETEFPVEVNVQYLNSGKKFEQGSMRDRRLVTVSRLVQSFALSGLVLTNTEAKKIARALLAMRWLERIPYSLTLPKKYLKLNPADILSVTMDGITHAIRIVKLDYGSPGLLKIEGAQEDFAVYDPDAVADEDEDDDEISLVGPTLAYLLDVPMLRDGDNDAGFYVAACGATSAWRGCILYVSRDGGASYSEQAALLSPTDIGRAETVLVSGPVTVFDRTNTVTVRMVSGTLESVSELDVLNGSNAGILGDEIIQWRTATLVSAGVYELSNLLRGRRGTDWAVDTHRIGERFIALSASTMQRMRPPSDEIGLARKYKAVSVGGKLAETAAINFTNTAAGLEPYSPVHVRGARDGSNNLTITWVRRTRIGGAWRDMVDAALGETSEAYEVEILDGSTVVRTITGLTSPTATYTAAQQTTDGLTPGDPVSVVVYQMSETVGRGYGRSATV